MKRFFITSPTNDRSNNLEQHRFLDIEETERPNDDDKGALLKKNHKFNYPPIDGYH